MSQPCWPTAHILAALQVQLGRLPHLHGLSPPRRGLSKGLQCYTPQMIPDLGADWDLTLTWNTTSMDAGLYLIMLA